MARFVQVHVVAHQVADLADQVTVVAEHAEAQQTPDAHPHLLAHQAAQAYHAEHLTDAEEVAEAQQTPDAAARMTAQENPADKLMAVAKHAEAQQTPDAVAVVVTVVLLAKIVGVRVIVLAVLATTVKETPAEHARQVVVVTMYAARLTAQAKAAEQVTDAAEHAEAQQTPDAARQVAHVLLGRLLRLQYLVALRLRRPGRVLQTVAVLVLVIVHRRVLLAL